MPAICPPEYATASTHRVVDNCSFSQVRIVSACSLREERECILATDTNARMT
jgi:hypothetical protein